MSKFEHSFEKVYEALITRYTAGCFSAGDVVKFDTKAIQKSDAYKGLTKSLKSRLDDMMRTSDAGETVIVITDVALGHDNPKAHTPTTMTIAYSQGGGRWVEPITIPGSLAEFMDAIEPGVNLVDKIPAVSKITYPVSTEAEEIDLKELEKNRTKGHASSTLHGESYSPDLNDTEIDIGVYFDITSAFNEWMNDSKYLHPKMKREMIFNEIMNKIKSYNNNYIKKFGENIIITDDDGKTCLCWENFSTTAAEAKCYAEDGIPDEALYEEIYDSIPKTGFESFDSYIYDNLNDFLEIIGADDYGDYVSARERRRDDYMSTVSSAWNNRFR